MEDPKTFSAPVTAFNHSSASVGKESGTPYEDARLDLDFENADVDEKQAAQSHSSSEGIRSETTVGATEDEETLQLQLAAIETKIKLKKLRDRKNGVAAAASENTARGSHMPAGEENSRLLSQKSGNLGLPNTARLAEDYGDKKLLRVYQTDGSRQADKEFNVDSGSDGKISDLEANTPISPLSSNINREKEREGEDPNIVDWDGPEDPQNPMNWPAWKVKAHIFLVSAITFIR